MPDSASVHVKLTFHCPAPAGDTAPVIEGAVRSMLKGVLVTDALAPVVSVTVPLTVCPAPSADTTMSDGQEAIGALPGVHTKCAVTGVLFQPLALGSGERLVVIEGGTETGGAIVSGITGESTRSRTPRKAADTR